MFYKVLADSIKFIGPDGSTVQARKDQVANIERRSDTKRLLADNSIKLIEDVKEQPVDRNLNTPDLATPESTLKAGDIVSVKMGENTEVGEWQGEDENGMYLVKFDNEEPMSVLPEQVEVLA